MPGVAHSAEHVMHDEEAKGTSAAVVDSICRSQDVIESPGISQIRI